MNWKSVTKNELGESILFSYGIPNAAKELVIEAVIVHANAALPPGTRFQVRGMSRAYADMQHYGIAWYTNDDIRVSTDKDFRSRFCDADESEELGCVLIALLTVPENA